MELLTPAFRLLVDQCREDGPSDAEMVARSDELLKPITKLVKEKYGLVQLDIVCTALLGLLLNLQTDLEKKAREAQKPDKHPHDAYLREMLTYKHLALWKVLFGRSSKEAPFCCRAHLIEHVIEQLLRPIDSADACLLMADVLAKTIMDDRDPRRMHMLDTVVDEMMKRVRRHCYQIAYGEDGVKAAAEAEAERKH